MARRGREREDAADKGTRAHSRSPISGNDRVSAEGGVLQMCAVLALVAGVRCGIVRALWRDWY
jgi:hypothetical protein